MSISKFNFSSSSHSNRSNNLFIYNMGKTFSNCFVFLQKFNIIFTWVISIVTDGAVNVLNFLINHRFFAIIWHYNLTEIYKNGAFNGYFLEISGIFCDILFFCSRKQNTKVAMIRLLGTRIFTRLLLLVCCLSLMSLLFLSRCGLDSTSISADETEIQAPQLSGKFLV